MSPPVQLGSKTACGGPGEPMSARFAEQKSSDALAGTGWRELPPALSGSTLQAADHPAPSRSIIVLGGKKASEEYRAEEGLKSGTAIHFHK